MKMTRTTIARPDVRLHIFCDYDLRVVVDAKPGETLEERKERAKAMLPATRVRPT
jgi:hypothetical protein